MACRLQGEARKRAAAAHERYLKRLGAERVAEDARLARHEREIAAGKRWMTPTDAIVLAVIAIVWLDLFLGALGW